MKIIAFILGFLVCSYVLAQDNKNEKQEIKDFSFHLTKNQDTLKSEISVEKQVNKERNDEIAQTIILYQKMIAELETEKQELIKANNHRRSDCGIKVEELDQKIEKLLLLIEKLSQP